MSGSEHKLENVFWLGGSPCAGKSSISEIIASRFGFDVYHVDEAFDVHAQGFDPIRHPTLTKWLASSWNQRWMQPLDSLVGDVIACYQEHFTMILEDIFSLPKRPLLVEGTALLPREVASVLGRRTRAIWVVPTIDFQRAHYSERDWARSIAAQCSNPEVAFHNWMERDIRFAKWIEAEASALHLPLLKVDGDRTIKENAEAVATHFLSNTHEALVFGSIKPNVQYVERRAAYVVIIHEGRVAVVNSGQTHFLPGGGSLPGERPEETVVREVHEELGRRVRLLNALGEATQYFYSSTENRHYKMLAVYFTGEFMDDPCDQIGEHELDWLVPAEAEQACFHPCHAWAILNLLV